MYVHILLGEKSRSSYATIFADYISRIRRFVKIAKPAKGRRKVNEPREGLHLIFVNGYGASKEKFGSEELAEEIKQRALTHGRDIYVELVSGGALDTVSSAWCSRSSEAAAGPCESEGGGSAGAGSGADILLVPLTTERAADELAKVLAIEQVYRAFMIINNRKYHK